MKPSGQHDTIERTKAGTRQVFKIVKSPTPYDPILELEFGTVPVYHEKRNIQLNGEKKHSKNLWAGSILLASGVAIMASTRGMNSPDSTTFALGVLTGTLGLVFLGGFLYEQKWEPASKYVLKDTLIDDMNEFTPLPNERIILEVKQLNRIWNLQTDQNGRINFDIGQIASEKWKETSLILHIKSIDRNNARFTYEITASFFIELQQQSEYEFQLQSLTKEIVSNLTKTKSAKIAVLDFQDLQGFTTTFGKFLSEELITRLFRTGRFEVVERRLLNKILDENKLAFTGIFDINTIKRLGRILGVDAIIAGTITDLGDSLRINARLISTETGEIYAVASAELMKDENIKVLMKN
jgi:TolB-like protein